MLSECRKFGLHLIMAHQHRGQLGDRLSGALENARLKVIFGVGRATARALIEDVFRPEVGTPRQQGTPSLSEQWESFCQKAQRLGHREMLVQLPDSDGVHRLRTCTMTPSVLNDAQREALCVELARHSGKAVSAMRRALAGRQTRSSVTYYERIPGRRDENIQDH
jgi:hypothetical protein